MTKLPESRSALGRFTDFNLWEEELSVERMRDFTSCRPGISGNKIAWSAADWTVTEGIQEEEFRIETVELSSLCSSQPRLTAFPALVSLRQGWIFLE